MSSICVLRNTFRHQSLSCIAILYLYRLKMRRDSWESTLPIIKVILALPRPDQRKARATGHLFLMRAFRYRNDNMIPLTDPVSVNQINLTGRRLFADILLLARTHFG